MLLGLEMNTVFINASSRMCGAFHMSNYLCQNIRFVLIVNKNDWMLAEICIVHSITFWLNHNMSDQLVIVQVITKVLRNVTCLTIVHALQLFE